MNNNNYVTNPNLIKELILSHQNKRMTDELGRMFMLLATNYSTDGRFIGYTYKSDMIAYALVQLCRTWQAFDVTKGSSAFSYYTTCIHNSFLQFLKKEKKESDIKKYKRIEHKIASQAINLW